MNNLLPTLVARTHIASKRYPRMTKDYQYFTVEYSLGVLCAIGHVVLEGETTSTTPKSNADYSKMSMGLWLSLLRNLCAEIADLKPKDGLPKVFADIGKSNLMDSVSQFVTKRNHDMHGNPISEADLEGELQERENLMAPLLQVWEQMSTWRLVCIDNILFEDGRMVYVGQQLHGETPSSIELQTQGGIEVSSGTHIKKHELYWVNLANINQRYRVSPLLIWSFESSPPRIGLFSKMIARGKERLEYNTNEGAVTLVLDSLNETPLQKLRGSFYSFLYRYNPSKLRAPEVQAEWRLHSRTGVVTDERKVSLKISNLSDKCGLSQMKTHQVFGSDVTVIPMESDVFTIECVQQAGQTMVEIRCDALENNETLDVEVYRLCFSEQGHYQLPQSELAYEYKQEILLDEDVPTKKDAVEIQGHDFEVVDPNSATPFRPILNTNLSIVNPNGIDIGDHFELILEIENIGFAIANNVDLELVLPDNFQMIHGKKILDTTIQPREKRTFTLMLCCWNAGVYNVFLRDVSYTDVHGKRFVSSATRGLYVLIQSNKIKAFEYAMIEAYEDLYLEPHEEMHLQSLQANTPGLTPEKYNRIEQNIRRKRILEIFDDKFSDYPLEPEEIVQAHRRDLVYSIHGVPIFGVCLDDDSRPNDTTQCFGLRTFLKKSALHKDSVLSYAPLLQEWISYEEVQKDKSYRQNFFYQWFAGIQRSMTQLLKTHQLMQSLREDFGGDSVNFSNVSFSMSLPIEKAQRVGCTPHDILYAKIDTTDYANTHIVVRLPNRSLLLNSLDTDLEIRHYTGDLQVASRRTAAIGIKVRWGKKTPMEKIQQQCHQVWNIAMLHWMRHLCTPEYLGGAKTYMTELTASMIPLFDSGLRMVSDETTSKFVWLYSASPEAALLSPFLVKFEQYWGYVRTSGSSIYIGFRCKDGIELSADLVNSVKFIPRDSRTFSEWKVNPATLTELVSIISFQQENWNSPHRIPSGLFDTWMARLIFQYGYIVYELCAHLQSTSISIDDLSTVLNVTQYRVNRMIRDVVRPEGVLVLNDDKITLGDVYRDKTDSWIAQQQVVQAQIWDTLSMVEKALEVTFPLDDGWIVAMPTTLRLWNSIAVYREEWQYGIHHERKLAIDVFIDRPYINRINAIGISGRFVGPKHLAVRDELYNIVAAHPDFEDHTVKKSESWPVYLTSKGIPKSLFNTGGAQWFCDTEDKQVEFTNQLVERMAYFATFAEDITKAVQQEDALLRTDWEAKQAKRYQQSTYASLVSTEQQLNLPKYTLALELPRLTKRLLEEDWSSACGKLSWPWDPARVQLDGRPKNFLRWGRKGISIGSDSWKPSVFLGVLIDGSDHKETLLDPNGSADLAIILSVHRKAKVEGLSGDEFVETAEWQQLVGRLLAEETEFTVIDHLQGASVNRWHPLHIRIPLVQIWKDCTNTEERYDHYVQWLQKGLDMVLAGGEIEALIASNSN